mmetsp:Transcript_61481/g.109582  ORF Transcript_61481/g.109582 Transcript_61481/m.109582 type:complete len:215 (+) Transcript_61481:1912-2556(+)
MLSITSLSKASKEELIQSCISVGIWSVESCGLLRYKSSSSSPEMDPIGGRGFSRVLSLPPRRFSSFRRRSFSFSFSPPTPPPRTNASSQSTWLTRNAALADLGGNTGSSPNSSSEAMKRQLKLGPLAALILLANSSLLSLSLSSCFVPGGLGRNKSRDSVGSFWRVTGRLSMVTDKEEGGGPSAELPPRNDRARFRGRLLMEPASMEEGERQAT